MRRHANWMKVLQDVGVFMYFVVFKNYSFFNLKIGVIDRFLFGLRILDELLTLVLKKSLLLLLLLLLLLYGSAQIFYVNRQTILAVKSDKKEIQKGQVKEIYLFSTSIL